MRHICQKEEPIVRGSAGSKLRAENVADLMVAHLAELDVEYVFLNPGTDTAPFQEAIARCLEARRPAPRVILCPHESVALSAAHAYYAATGRPQVVMVHVDVGTQNLGSMVHNAFRGEAAVVVIAGRTPVTSLGELPGGRDHVVHWQQDVPDQAGIVRSYVKAALDLERPETVTAQLTRGFQLAAAPSPGPVYVTVHRELLMESAPPRSSTDCDVRRHRVPAGTSPDPAAVEAAADIVAASERPVIVTTRVGRDPEVIPSLVALAEATGAVVVDRRERMNFPSTHSAYVTRPSSVRRALEESDLLILVDCAVPWVPTLAAPPADAKVISVDYDPVKSTTPGWAFPVDLALQCTPRLGVRSLVDALRRREVTARDHWLTEPHAGSPEQFGPTNGTFPMASVARALARALSDDDIIIEEATTNAEALREYLPRDLPGSIFHAGGSGLGWGLGGALGAKLAHPDRTVVAVVGDGSFLFSSPVAALWTARRVHAPFLTVILANGGYAASRRPVLDWFPEGESAARADVVGTRLDDPPDFAAVAVACGAEGIEVTPDRSLDSALQEGLRRTRQGRCAVINIPVSSPWFDQDAPAWEA